MNDKDFKELVGQAIEKIKIQGKPSYDEENTGCFYLFSDGSCCIVGHMMPTDEIKKQADSLCESSIGIIFKDTQTTQDYLPIGLETWVSQFTEKQIDVLSELQKVHDNWIVAGKELTFKLFDKIYNTLQ